MRGLRLIVAVLAGLSAGGATAGDAPQRFVPLVLRAGLNPVRNIAGDGVAGSISRDWRENGNAWGYHIFTVRAGDSIATVDDRDRFVDRPHTGEDAIMAVRFARGGLARRRTTFALVAEREVTGPVPDPAPTTIRIYALERSHEPLGTPYQFVLLRRFVAARRYCSADNALANELGIALPRGYSGATTPDGC